MIWSTRNVSQLVSYYSLYSSARSDALYTEDEMDVSALNLGMIAAYYNISCERHLLVTF